MEADTALTIRSATLGPTFFGLATAFFLVAFAGDFLATGLGAFLGLFLAATFLATTFLGLFFATAGFFDFLGVVIFFTEVFFAAAFLAFFGVAFLTVAAGFLTAACLALGAAAFAAGFFASLLWYCLSFSNLLLRHFRQ